MKNLIDDYALMSPLRYSNNWLKLVIVTFGLLFGVSSKSPIIIFFIAICMSFATVYLGKIPIRFYTGLMLAPLVFAVMGSIVILFFFGSGNEVFSISILTSNLSVNREGFNMAVVVISRTISGMSCLFFLALSTPIVELFSVIKTSRIPEPLIELSMLMYRYIFVFLDVAMNIKYAQTVRLGYKDFLSSIRSMSMLLSTLFIRSWEQGEKTYLSMNSRCYDGKLTLSTTNRPVKISEVILTSSYFVFIIATSYVINYISI
jgi:cobalt/nickel transport system permease protein